VERRLEFVPLDALRESGSVLFREHSPEEISSLARSIKRVGLLHNLVVRRLPDGAYEILSGHGRAKAAKLAGCEQVPALVLDASDCEAELALIDANVEVRPPSPMELARAIRRRRELLARVKRPGRPGKQNQGQNDLDFPGEGQVRDVVARELGISPRQVERYDALNDLVPELQLLVEKGKLGVVAGSYLARLPPGVQQDLYEALGDAVSDFRAEELKRLKEEQERGYLVLQVLQRKVEELEAQLASWKEAYGSREELERQLEALRRKKQQLTYDVLDREQALRLQVQRYRRPRAALLHIVETVGGEVQSALPEVKTLLEQGPLDAATATHLVRWIQVFRHMAEVLEPHVERALTGEKPCEPRKEAVSVGSR
jgi:ParB family chromosome partitioning protein